MIEDYFLTIEKVLQDFPTIRSRALAQKVYNHHQGYHSGKIVFENGYSLEFIEVVDTEQQEKVKYRYHYMDEKQALIFRYDNAPHHKEVKTFPHHKHIPEEVTTSQEPDLHTVLMEITHYHRGER
ncbi:MAG: DUF6516 family protein [Anaerolineales bacterium]|nr:DUF6516 family protein [Anaerolineales bacterium]